ncbi:MAG TPA: winged helix-turn-helix domain-containing protein, partial [Actinomycetota bacterium]|nr:winged helix-turn-helix domain-containing protein [Actinomycetota bacterium]
MDLAFGTSYELLLNIWAYQAPELAAAPDVRPPSFVAVPKRLARTVREAIERVGAGPHWGNFVGFAAVEPKVTDVTSLIRRMESAPAIDVRLTAIGARSPSLRAQVDPAVFADAAHGERTAQGELIARFAKSAKERADFGKLLNLGVAETKRAIIDVLRRWHRDVFQPQEAEVEAALSRDAAAKDSFRPRVAPETLVEIATNGLEYRPEPWARRVVLIPQLCWRPWNVLLDHQDASIICYPVSDESLGVDGDEPPPSLVRLHQALGDDKRLRILKRLAEGSASLQELAAVANLAKSSAHHHLVILRSAGLIRTTTE